MNSSSQLFVLYQNVSLSNRSDKNRLEVHVDVSSYESKMQHNNGEK